MENRLNVLSSRAGFNTALRHFKIVNDFVKAIKEGENLADVVNVALDRGELQPYQVRSLLNVLLVDKFMYASSAHNLKQDITDATTIIEKIGALTGLQIVLAYHNPQSGLMLINPKREEHWKECLPLIMNELVVLYANLVTDAERDIKKEAIEHMIALLYGEEVKQRPEYLGKPAVHSSSMYTIATKPEERNTRKSHITPRYSVMVTNELFHNGNVEAWKKIIESYVNKFVGTEVIIWYENEHINDINALFKWGKVKNGSLIVFSVAGKGISKVSKLQRYLFEGASPRFEVFLKAGAGQILNLF